MAFAFTLNRSSSGQLSKLFRNFGVCRNFGVTLSQLCSITTAVTLPRTVLSFRPLLSSKCKVKKLNTATVPATESFMEGEVVSTGRKRERTTSSGSSKSDKGGARNIKHDDILWPPTRKGMEQLDKSAFDKNISVPVIVIYEDQIHPSVLSQVKPFLLKVQGIKPIQEDETNTGKTDENNTNRKTKKIYLNPDLLKKRSFDDFVRHEAKLDSNIVATIRHDIVKFTYDNWTWYQIFDSILPDEHEKVASFSQVGHILHLNLRDHHLPYKHIISQVLLDKISHIKTVVNKLSNIDNTYRNFQMEILAGDKNTVAHVKENRCEYEFDFAHVYWNPRLCAEHERVVKWLNPGDILYDVFAGVGPFAVPAAKKKSFVLANDLNPESYKWLEHNIKKNKVQHLVRCFNQDGKDFIKQTFANDLMDRLKKSENPDSTQAFDFKNKKFHVVMNLPAIAVEFLDVFWGTLQKVDSKLINRDMIVIVHVYCFIKDTEGFKEKALKLAEEKLKYQIPKKNVLEVTEVRNVAPNKEMLRVSFTLPHEILLNPLENPLKRKHSETELSHKHD